jgi:Mg2+/Co2+ transporter CorB
MNEWTIVLVLISLIGLISAIVKPLTSLTKSITELTVIVKGLKEGLASQKSAADEEHKRIWEHNKEQDELLQKHEVKLAKIDV